MEETTSQPADFDFTAAVDTKKGLVVGIGAAAVIAGVTGLVLGNWILAVALGIVLGFVIARRTQ